MFKQEEHADSEIEMQDQGVIEQRYIESSPQRLLTPSQALMHEDIVILDDQNIQGKKKNTSKFGRQIQKDKEQFSQQDSRQANEQEYGQINQENSDLFDKNTDKQQLINKQETIYLQKSNSALRKRKCLRIILLVLLEIFIVGLFLGYYYKLGYYRGEIRFVENEKIILNIKKCVLKVLDYSEDIYSQQDINFYQTLTIPDQIEENLILMYSYTDVQRLDYESSFNLEESDDTKEITIENAIDFESCQISMLVYKPTVIKQLKIDCFREDCFILMNSKQLEIEDLNISGFSIDITSNYLKAKSLNVESYFGYIELNDAYFEKSQLEISTGDIAIQSTKSIEVSVEMASKLYCFTTFSDEEIKTDIKDISPDCIPVTLSFNNQNYISEEQSTQNIVAQRCFTGSAVIKSAGDEQNQQLLVRSTFGNVFINVLEKPGDSASFSKRQSFDKDLYGSDRQNINLSTLSQQQVQKLIEKVQNPKVYDPIFLLVFGSKYTQSSTFTQWQITYNPAYTYLKPWWLGILTYTLLTTEFYYKDLTLAPGFCPYVPTLTKDRIIAIQDILSKAFINEESKGIKILSFSWQNGVDLPKLKFQPQEQYNGQKDIKFGSDYLEEWLNFEKDQDSTIYETYFMLQQNSKTLFYKIILIYIFTIFIKQFINKDILYAALVISIILSIILGLVFMIGIAYLVNMNYIYLLEFMKHVDTYSDIVQVSNKKDEESYNLNYDEEIIDQNVDKILNQDKQSTMVDQANNYKYTLSSIFNLFYTLIYLSPPLSAYIDQVVFLLQKARTNSIRSFYSIIFAKIENTNEKNIDESIHNLDQDVISGVDLKCLYEQYCYLNRLLERKLDSRESMKLLKQKGFKINIKQDSLVSYFTYIKYNSSKKIIMNNSDFSSLDLFIKSCCKLTKFECDSIDSKSFEKYYKEFCQQNHLDKKDYNERSLKKDYGIETKFIPEQVVERDSDSSILKRNIKYIIDKNRVLNNFKLLQSQEIIDLYSASEDANKLNESIIHIYAPKGWFLYDCLTVISHLALILFLGSPVIALIIFIRVQQFPYVLIPFQKYITQQNYFRIIKKIINQKILKQKQRDDLKFNFSVIPMKLMKDNRLIQTMTIISLIFWILCTWDLIYYYMLMNFPQERYFQNYSKSHKFRKIVSRIMWVIALLAIYFIFTYICLTLTWLVLSAIINPQAFLPYATSAATFVTLITNKYHQFQAISESGFQKILIFIKKSSENQFQEILQKMDIVEKVQGLMPTNEIKNLVQEAGQMGIIDSQLTDTIQNNLEIMVRDPSAVLDLGKELIEIAQDPQEYASNLMIKFEDKIKEQLKITLSKYLPYMYSNIIDLLENLLKGQKSTIKENLIFLLKGLTEEVKNAKKLNIEKDQIKIQRQIEILEYHIVQQIKALSNENEESVDQKKQELINSVCSIIYQVIIFKELDNKNKEKVLNQKDTTFVSFNKDEDQEKKQKNQNNKENSKTSPYITNIQGDKDGAQLINKGDKQIKRIQNNDKLDLLDEEDDQDLNDDEENEDRNKDEEDEDKESEDEDVVLQHKKSIEKAIQHLFSLYKHYEEKNSKILDNKSIVQNSNPLNYLSLLNDIFKISIEINDNNGVIQLSKVFQALKLFLSKAIQNSNIENQLSFADLLELQTQCAFSSIQCIRQPQISEQSKLCFKLQKELKQEYVLANKLEIEQSKQQEDICSYIDSKDEESDEESADEEKQISIEEDKSDSFISLYLNWLSGSLLDIPTETINDIFKDLVKEFKEYKDLQQILTQNEQSGKGRRLEGYTKNLQKTQLFFNFIDILLNNPQQSIKKLVESTLKFSGNNDKNFTQFLFILLKFKFPQISSVQEIKSLSEISDFKDCTIRHIKLDYGQLMGLLLFLSDNLKQNETQYFLKIIFDQNQVIFLKSYILFIIILIFIKKFPENRIPLFLNLYGLLSSNNESELHNYLNFFNFEQLKLLVMHHGKYQKLSQEDFLLVYMFLQDKYGKLMSTTPHRIKQAFENIFDQKIQLNKLKNQEYCISLISELNITSELLSNNLINNDKASPQMQKDIQQGVQSLLMIQKSGLISPIVLSKIIKLLSFDESIKLLNIKQNEIQVFSKILSIRNLKPSFSDIQTSLQKESILELSQLLNIEEKPLSTLIYFISSTSVQQIQSNIEEIMNKNLGSFSQFIKQSGQVMKHVQQRWSQIEQIQEDLFKGKIPLDLLRDVSLFNILPSNTETMHYILTTCFKNLSHQVNAIIKYKYDISSINSQNLNEILFEESAKKQNKNKGLFTLFQIFKNHSNPYKTKQYFLQYLSDEQKYQPLLIACLFNYLSGQSDGVEFNCNPEDFKSQNIEKKFNTKLSVEQYLSKRLEIKPEFFQSLPHITFENSLLSCRQMLKLYRQVDYQIQIQNQNQESINKMKSQKSQKNSQTQNLDQVQQLQQNKNKTGENKPILNRINISEQEVEQFSFLFRHQKCNSVFMGRNLKLPVELIEFQQEFHMIRASGQKNRILGIEKISQNVYMAKVLQKVGVIPEELVTMLKLFYGYFEFDNQLKIQKEFNLLDNFSFKCLQNTMKLYVDINWYGTPVENRNLIQQSLQMNQIVKEMNVDTKILSLFYCFNSVFLSIKTFCTGEFEILKFSKKETTNIAISIMGIMKFVSNDLNSIMLCKQIYNKLKSKNRLIGQYEEINIKEEDIKLENQKDSGQTVALKKSNYFDYKAYLLCKYLYISPIWLSLITGIHSSWYYVVYKYFYYQRYEKKNILDNPLLLIVIIFKLKQCPTILKELLIQNQLAIISSDIFDKQKQNSSTIIKELQQQKQKLIKEQNNILALIFSAKIDSFTELNRQFLYYKTILERIAYYQYFQSGKKFDYKFSYKACEQILQDCMKQDRIYELFDDYIHQRQIDYIFNKYIYLVSYNFRIQNIFDFIGLRFQIQKIIQQLQNLKFYQNFIIFLKILIYSTNIINIQNRDSVQKKGLYDLLIDVFQNINNNYCDYRYKDTKSQENIEYHHMRVKEHFGCDPIMQLIVISTISNLQHSYHNLHNYTERGPTHYQIVSYEINFLLSTLEYFYFFSESFSELNKFKMFQFLGLSCGFILNVKDILSCYSYQTLFDSTFIQTFKNVKSENIFEEQKKYFELKVLKSLLHTIKLREQKSTHLNILDENEVSYFRVFISEVYEKIAVSSQLVSQDFIDDLIHVYKDFIYPYFKEKKYESIYSLFLKKNTLENQQNLIQEEKEFQKKIQCQNFEFFVDFSFSNYSSISKYDYFQQYEKDLNLISSFLYINSFWLSFYERFKLYDNFQNHVQVLCSSLKSNKKSLSQIVALSLQSINYNVPCINECMQFNIQKFNYLLQYLDYAAPGYGSVITNFVQESSFSDENKIALEKLLQVNLYIKEHLLDIVEFSKYFKSKTYASYQNLYKFIIETTADSYTTLEPGQKKVNFLDFWQNNVYLDKDKESQQNQLLFNICNSIFYQNGVKVDPEVVYPQTGELKESYKNQAKIIRKIIENKWEFLSELLTDVSLKKSFCELFDLTPNTYSLVEFLFVIKPEIPCMLGIKEKRNHYLNEENRKSYIDQLVQYGIKLNEEEKEQIEMIMIISNQSLPHLVDFLSHLTQKKGVSFNLNSFLLNNISSFDLSNTQVSQEELLLVLQPFLLIKFSIQVDWNDIYQKLVYNNNQMNRKNRELALKYSSNIFSMTSAILNSFDILSAIFLSDITNIKDSHDIFSSMSSNIKQNRNRHKIVDLKKQINLKHYSFLTLFHINRIGQIETFNLNLFLTLEKEKEKENQIGSNSPDTLQYLIQTHQFIQKQNEQTNQSFRSRFLMPNESKTQNNINNIINQGFNKEMCEKLTSFICGAPYQVLSKSNKLMKFMQKSSQTLVIYKLDTILEQIINEDDEELIITFDISVDKLFHKIQQLYYICYNSIELSKINKDLLMKSQIKLLTSIINICLDEKWGLSQQQEFKNIEKEKKLVENVISIYIGQQSEHPFEQIKEDLTHYLIQNFTELQGFLTKKKMLNMFKKLNVLLNRSIINLKDETIVDEYITLLTSISRVYIDKSMVQNIIKMVVKDDYSCLLQIIKDSKLVSEKDAEFIGQTIDKISNLSIFKKRKELKDIQKPPQQAAQSDQMKDILKRAQEGSISIRDIFHSIDSQGDGNGLISLTEFCQFLLRTGIQMSEHRTNELFATIKKNRKNGQTSVDETQLNFEEFEQAFNYLNSKKADMSLEKLGISPALLILSLGTLVVILVLLLVFIFLGIKAFALGGTFGSIVNSIIPVVATTGTAQSQSDKKESLKEDNIKDVVNDTEQILHSDKL